MKLNTFLTAFSQGFQTPNRFRCQVFLPLGLLTAIVTQSLLDNTIDFLIPTGLRDLKGILGAPHVAEWLGRGLLVEAARVPSRSMETMSQTLYGFSERFPYHTEYTSFDCTVLMPMVGNDNSVPKFFSYWQNYIQNGLSGARSGYDFAFPSTYYGTILLSLLDTKSQPTITYQLEKVYPQMVESAPISWDTTNEFLKLPVSFIYSYWHIVPSTPLPLV